MRKDKRIWPISKRSFILFLLHCIFTVFLMGFIIYIFIDYSGTVSSLYVFVILLIILCFMAICIAYYKYVYIPYMKTLKIMEQFNNGYTVDGIFKIKFFLSGAMENTLNKIHEILNRQYAIDISKKQAEYLALQNQINPHFLYNTLEAIRGDALNEGMESIAEMTEALATFFRYNITKVDHLVTLEDELSNAENYFLIQQYRFGDKLSLSIKYGNEQDVNIFDYKLPKLTLQPIIENSIYHGLECKIDKGTITINIETTQSRLLINIIDDGIGMEENVLNTLNRKLNQPSLDYVKEDEQAKGGIALINVNNRIKLLFGEQYGLYISSTLNYGTDVEITLPLMKS